MPTLTTRQRQVMAEVATGDDFDVIAERMGIGQQTLKNHIHDARKRLGAVSTIDAFVRLGWLIVPAVEVNGERQATQVQGQGEGVRLSEIQGVSNRHAQASAGRVSVRRTEGYTRQLRARREGR